MTLRASDVRILRYSVPVDDRVHALPVPCSDIVHVATRRADVVEVWAKVYDGVPVPSLPVQVVGTGWPFPAHHRRHIATAINYDTGLVWHLLEMHPDALEENG